MKVVIVELPAKAKTINKYLGKDYDVYASFGHVRDLTAKDGSVDPDNDFAMRWEVDAKAAKRLSDIGSAVKNADSVILATDPDREGEAISWHVYEILKGKKLLKDKRVDRVVFNAVTKEAVQDAMRHPREIDEALVDAYRARRALDYLVGFNLSPVLWRKLPGARSAGRVQSVALRIVCDRELEIEKFVAREYWSILAHLKTQADAPFTARLVGADGKKIGRLDVGSGDGGRGLSRRRSKRPAFTVASVEAKPVKRHPYPPFTTSTLQQEASRKLGLAPARTMQIAQRLYEGVDIGDGAVGLITYMRTDGVDLAPEAVAGARKRHRQGFRRRICARRAAQISRSRPRTRRKRTRRSARPTWRAARKDIARHLEPEQAKLYELIWTRTIACQMESAELERTTVEILAEAGGAKTRVPRHRPGRALRRLPRALSGRQRRRGRRGFGAAAADEGGRAADQGAHRREPAFHRAAAALHRGDARQAHGGARHRPALDLRLDARRAARARLCAHREEAPDPRGQGPARHRLSRVVLRQICRL